MSRQQHQSRLQSLGLSPGANGQSDTAPPVPPPDVPEQAPEVPADDLSVEQRNAVELMQVKADGDALERRVNDLIEQLLALQAQVRECEQSEQFLRSALAAADDNDLIRCAVQTRSAIEQQQKTLQRASECESALVRLRDRAQPAQRAAIDRYLAERAATRTARPALLTDIEIDGQ